MSVVKSERPGLTQIDLYEMLKSKAWDDGEAFAEACANTEGVTERASYLGTSFVARDMLSIVDALDEDGKLRYWGRSYGTDMGQTFAAMFPDRIDRMILDSVQKGSDYWSGSWATSMYGTEYALEHFFEECINAGPELCPSIANFTGPDTTVKELIDAISDGFQELIDNPIYVPPELMAHGFYRPAGVPLHSELKYRLMQFNYYPYQWAALSMIVNTLLTRSWDEYFLFLGELLAPQNETATPEIPWNKGLHNFYGIACGDATFRASSSEEMYNLVRTQQAKGSFSDGFMPQSWTCAHWPFQAVEGYEGNFDQIKTSFPILFVNSKWDPITPLDAAFDASKGFIGSRLLTHKGHGHGSMNHPSNCTNKALSDYVNNGILPEVGTECEPNETAYENFLNSVVEGVEPANARRSNKQPDHVLNKAIRKASRELFQRTSLDF